MIKINGTTSFLIDKIFVQFEGLMFQHTTGIPMCTNCAPLLADFYLYAYEADFLQWLPINKDRILANIRQWIFPFHV
jgi:hypothetical protein